MSATKLPSTRAVASAADLELPAQLVQAVIGKVRVSGSVLYDLDALAQERCDAIRVLAEQALRRLAPDRDALEAVRALLLMIQDYALRLSDDINAAAEDHGCNYVDASTRASAAPR